MNPIKIDDISAPEMDLFARATENELRTYEGTGLFIAESAYVALRALEAGYEPVAMLTETDRAEAEALPVFNALGKGLQDTVPVYMADRELIENITGHKLVRGLWTVFRRKPEPDTIDFLKDKKRIAVLVDVVNAANVGAIIRSAAALGLDGDLLTHPSVDPYTRRVLRVSMGTVFQIPCAKASWEESQSNALMDLIKSNGFKTVSLALTEDSIPGVSSEIRSQERLALILGTEGTGLPKQVIEASDYRIRFPMQRGVDSLNVACAASISFWELMK